MDFLQPSDRGRGINFSCPPKTERPRGFPCGRILFMSRCRPWVRHNRDAVFAGGYVDGGRQKTYDVTVFRSEREESFGRTGAGMPARRTTGAGCVRVIGKVGDIMETPFGYHLVKVTAKTPAQLAKGSQPAKIETIFPDVPL